MKKLFTMRIDEDVLKKLRKEAAELRLPVSTYINLLLAQAVKKK